MTERIQPSSKVWTTNISRTTWNGKKYLIRFPATKLSGEQIQILQGQIHHVDNDE